jgi:hypothetical protein
MLQASVIVDRARISLIDPREVHWSDAELYDYLSAGQRAVVQLKPSAYTITELVSLAAGVVQNLPSEGLQLFDIYFNASGAGITQVGREVLTEMLPQWAVATQTVDAEHWMSDARDPRRFLVYPPNTGAGSVMAHYAAYPPTVDISTGSVLVIPESYDMALWASVMAQALAKNSRRQDLGKSQIFFSIFTGLVTGRMQAKEINAPRLDVQERA